MEVTRASLCKRVMHLLCDLLKRKLPDELDPVADLVEAVADDVIDLKAEAGRPPSPEPSEPVEPEVKKIQ